MAAILIPGELDAGKKESVFLMDLPAVQRFTNQANAIDRVDLFIPEGPARDRIMKEPSPARAARPTTMDVDAERRAAPSNAGHDRCFSDESNHSIRALFDCGALSYFAST